MPHRIYWIDNLKAIGIILVVIGHHKIPEFSRGLIYSFHMPLFFFISGLLFTIEKYENLNFLVYRRIRNLLIPYFIFALIQAGYDILKLAIKSQPYEILEKLYGIVTFSSYWFIGSLLLTEISFYIFIKNVKNKYFYFTAIVFFSVFGFWINSGEIAIPGLLYLFPYLSIIVLLPSTIVFYSIGFFLKKTLHDVGFDKFFHRGLYLFLIIMISHFLLFKIAYQHYGQFSLDHQNHLFLYYFLVLLGIAGSIIIANSIGNNQLLNLIARNTLIIYILHSNPGTVKKILAFAGYYVDLTSINIIDAIICTFLIILLILPFGMGFRKKMPWIFG